MPPAGHISWRAAESQLPLTFRAAPTELGAQVVREARAVVGRLGTLA